MKIELSLNENLKKKAIVFSHERSGTHFLMNTLALNFGYLANPWVNLDWETGFNFYNSAELSSFFKQLLGVKAQNVFKSHHSADFFKDLMPQLLEDFFVFYIYRNPFEVMPSYYKYAQNVPWDEAPTYQDLNGFMTAAPEGAMLRYQKKQVPSILHRWESHVTGWLKNIKTYGGIPIKYEDLNMDFHKTVLNIGALLEMPIEKSVRPPLETNVVQPNTKTSRPGSEITKSQTNYMINTVGTTLQKYGLKTPDSNLGMSNSK